MLITYQRKLMEVYRNYNQLGACVRALERVLLSVCPAGVVRTRARPAPMFLNHQDKILSKTSEAARTPRRVHTQESEGSARKPPLLRSNPERGGGCLSGAAPNSTSDRKSVV